MKTIITLSALALASNVALAGAFDYENQIGSQDLDPNVHVSDNIRNPDASNFNVRISLHDWYQGNHDVQNVPYKYDGVELKTEGELFTSYDAWSQSNPDLAS